MVLQVRAAAQRSGNHGRPEVGLNWQVAFFSSTIFDSNMLPEPPALTLKHRFPAALKDYVKFNKFLPSRIVVYRDGVGDGQLHSVVNYEVSQIIESIKSMGQDYM